MDSNFGNRLKNPIRIKFNRFKINGSEKLPTCLSLFQIILSTLTSTLNQSTKKKKIITTDSLITLLPITTLQQEIYTYQSSLEIPVGDLKNHWTENKICFSS